MFRKLLDARNRRYAALGGGVLVMFVLLAVSAWFAASDRVIVSAVLAGLGALTLAIPSLFAGVAIGRTVLFEEVDRQNQDLLKKRLSIAEARMEKRLSIAEARMEEARSSNQKTAERLDQHARDVSVDELVRIRSALASSHAEIQLLYSALAKTRSGADAVDQINAQLNEQLLAVEGDVRNLKARVGHTDLQVKAQADDSELQGLGTDEVLSAPDADELKR